jgi:hypothetical protein
MAQSSLHICKQYEATARDRAINQPLGPGFRTYISQRKPVLEFSSVLMNLWKRPSEIDLGCHPCREIVKVAESGANPIKA